MILLLHLRKETLSTGYLYQATQKIHGGSRSEIQGKWLMCSVHIHVKIALPG